MNSNRSCVYLPHPKGIRTAAYKPPQYNPPCPWRLTFNHHGRCFTEEITAQSIEDAALLIGKGIPIVAEFDDRGKGSWMHCHPSEIAKIALNPVLARQQRSVRFQMETDHAFPQF